MWKFAFVLMSVFSLFSINRAQSGRKTTTESPTTEVPTVSEINKQSVDYSESAPRKPNSIAISPNGNIKKSQPKTKSNGKTQTKQNTSASPKLNQGETDGEDVLTVETNLITIPVSVYDRNGIYIPNLNKDNFKIFEDGKEQEIAYFGTSDKPFTVILLIDVSPSTAYKIEEIQNAAIAFTNQLKARDNVSVVEFDEKTHVLTDATNDREKIHKAIRKADFGDGTSLYDAIDFSLRKRLSKIEGRKAIVLFTDGVDTTSDKNDYESTVREAEESDTLIFPIYYNTFLENLSIGGGNAVGYGTTGNEYAFGKKYLEDLSAATGGRVFRPEAASGGLTAAFEGIAEELRRQYNIGYYPKEDAPAGQRKQIKVRVNRPNLVIRSRDSYIPGGNNSKPIAPKAETKSN